MIINRKLTPFALKAQAALLGLTAGLAFPAQAQAQETTTSPAESAAALGSDSQAAGLEEIIVTAQRRAESLQDVPIAVAAVTSDTLEETGISTTRDLPQLVPSVQFTRSGASGLLFVRGVGTTTGAAGEEGANAVYVDGVYLGDLAQSINNFNNIERIEVLKGPQGTLFGRNAIGGLIHVITRAPGDEFEIDGQFGVANYETVSSQLYIGGPVSDIISADIAWTGLHQNEGWGRNLTLDRKNKFQDYWGVRSKAVLRASDAVTITLAGDYYKNEDNLILGYKIDPGTVGTGGVTGPAGHDTTENDYPITRQKIWGFSLTGEADIGLGTLTSISAIRNSANDSFVDVDGGPLPLFRFGFEPRSRTYQQELRLSSNDTTPLSWQAGVFYLRSEVTNYLIFSGSAFPATLAAQEILGELNTDSYATFGEVSYWVTPSTQLTGGIRYTMDRRDFEGSQTAILANGTRLAPDVQDSKLKYNEWTYRVALRQDLTDDINVYASINRGFKAGSYGMQNPLNAPYQPQYIMAYEVGLKSELFDRRLRLNLAAYHYDIDDYQVRSASGANPGSSLVLNAATVKVDGFDLEFEAAPTDQLRLFGGFTYLNSRFDKFGGPGSDFLAPIVYPNPATCPADRLGTADPGVLLPGPRTGGFTSCLGDVSGNKTPNAPDFAASLGASYAVPVGDSGEVRFSVLYSYNSGYAFEPDNFARQSDYSLVNASVEYRPAESFGIEIWGSNLTNEEYAVQKVTTNTGVTNGLGAPRTYGVNLKFNF